MSYDRRKQAAMDDPTFTKKFEEATEQLSSVRALLKTLLPAFASRKLEIDAKGTQNLLREIDKWLQEA